MEKTDLPLPVQNHISIKSELEPKNPWIAFPELCSSSFSKIGLGHFFQIIFWLNIKFIRKGFPEWERLSPQYMHVTNPYKASTGEKDIYITDLPKTK